MGKTRQAVILVIDDVEAGRYAIARTLAQAGYQVLEGACGADCLRLVRGEPKPDLIVLDIQLPDLDGFEVCRRLKADPATAAIPVLHVTANYRDDSHKVQGLNCGADAFLIQPVPADELIATVSALLRVRQAEHNAQELARNWQRTFDAISDGIGLLDAQGRLVRGNRALQRILGRDEAALAGAAGKDLLAEFFSPGAETLYEALALARDAEAVERAAGERWFRVTLEPIHDETGSLSGAVLILTDVTLQKQAERALRQSEQRYSALFANKINGMAHCRVITDEDGRPVDYWIVQINAAYERIIGIKKADIEGRRVKEVFPDIENYAFDYIGVYGKIALEGGEIKFEEYFEATGQYLSIYAYSPQPGEFAAIFTDVTDRKRAEAELQKAHQQLQTIVESITDGLLVLDRDWRYTYFSETGARMIGMRREELIGRIVWDLFPHARETKFYEEYHRAMATGQPAHFEEFYPEPLNLWLECHCYPSAEGLSVYFRDVTDRKRAEAALRESETRLRLAQEAGKIGVWEWDLEAGETFMTPECYLLWGLQPQPGPDRRDWFELIHPDDREQPRRQAEVFLRAGGDWRNEFRVIHPDGQVHWLLSQGQATQIKNGRVVRAHGCTMDITGQKQAEEELRAANSSLAEADRRKDEFLAILAHELRNPLAPVRYAIQILHMPGAPEATRQRQQTIIERQITHMARLLDDLLDVSRVTRGKVELRPQPLCLGEVLAHAAETVRPTCEGRHQQLHFAPPPEDLRVEADIDRLAQVVGNLLVNACKFTGEGGQIWLEAAREAADQAVIRVRDNGGGIAPEILPRIFELFVQADDPRHRSQGGLGIGLTLVRSLVEMHGGTVEARSAGEGRGSEFIIRLPALPEEPIEEPAPHITLPEAADHRIRRILVVDDIADSAAALAELLTLWGHEARAVHDGLAAIETVCDWRPEVVLLDIGMPGIDGYETARRLREAHGRYGLMLVALTGFGQEADREAAHAAGFDAHLVKPVDTTSLRDLLARLSD